MDELLSTGEAARLCGVSRSTFKRWFARFKAQPRRTPGGDIRVSCQELEAFASQFGLPLEPFGQEAAALVAVPDHALENALVTALRRNIPLAVTAVARDETAFGFELARLEPRLILLGIGPTPEATAARCRRIRDFLPQQALRIGLAADTDDSLALPGGPDIALGADTRRGSLDRFILELAAPGLRKAM